MHNPSKWYDFNNHKELRRLRKDVNDNSSLKIELTASVIIAIWTFFLADIFEDSSNCFKICMCAILTGAVIFGVVFLPTIFHYFKIRRSGNIIYNGKNATSIFDDEIVYDVLVAYEYSNSIKQIKESDELSKELAVFYKIEINYYISKSIRALFKFNSNIPNIYGNKEYQIRKERVCNVMNLIKRIIENNQIVLDNDIDRKYNNLLKTVETKIP